MTRPLGIVSTAATGRAVLAVQNVRHMSLVLSATLAKLGSGVLEPTDARVSCKIIIILIINCINSKNLDTIHFYELYFNINSFYCKHP